MGRYVWLSLLLIVTACLSTLLMLQNTERQRPPPQQQLNLRPDAFMIQADYYEYDDHGLLHSHLFTPKITHYEHENSAQFSKPNFMIYTDNQQSLWYITADHGISHHGISDIYLWDHVHIRQPQQATNVETDIMTDRVTILPHQSLAKTEEEVTITRPDSIVKAKGMETDLKTGIVKLLSHSQGIYSASRSTPLPGVALHDQAFSERENP